MKRNYAAICLISAAVGAAASSFLRPMTEPRTAAAQDQLAPVRNRFRTRPSRPQPPAPVVDRDRLPDVLEEVTPTPPVDEHPETNVTTETNVKEETREARLPKPTGFAPVDDSQWDDWTPEERTNIAVYEKANRGVVNITTRTVRADYFMMATIDTDGTGSGSIIDKRGHILTNLHVVEGAREIRATLHNGEDFEAGLVGQDPVNDIAVLRIAAPAEMLHPISLGEASGRQRVGQKVYAIGNPFGLDRTLTVGIVSSLNRSIPSRNGRTMKSIIQIDAALNRGSSGGPLLNSRGQLIGMNTAIASNTGENTGVGFAIPISTIDRVVPQLIEKGRVIRPTAGIAHVHPTEAGLLVAALIPGGPAEQAGLRSFRVQRVQRQRGPYLYQSTMVDRSHADIIIAAEGQALRSFDELLTIVEEKTSGDSVVLTILRDGEEREVVLRLTAEE